MEVVEITEMEVGKIKALTMREDSKTSVLTVRVDTTNLLTNLKLNVTGVINLVIIDLNFIPDCHETQKSQRSQTL